MAVGVVERFEEGFGHFLMIVVDESEQWDGEVVVDR